MAVCNWCKNEMLDPATITCVQAVKFPDGETVAAIPYTPEDDMSRCHDCGVAAGGLHHPGCDMEECPRCGGQLIGCGCLDDE